MFLLKLWLFVFDVFKNIQLYYNILVYSIVKIKCDIQWSYIHILLYVNLIKKRISNNIYYKFIHHIVLNVIYLVLINNCTKLFCYLIINKYELSDKYIMSDTIFEQLMPFE